MEKLIVSIPVTAAAAVLVNRGSIVTARTISVRNGGSIQSAIDPTNDGDTTIIQGGVICSKN